MMRNLTFLRRSVANTLVASIRAAKADLRCQKETTNVLYEFIREKTSIICYSIERHVIMCAQIVFSFHTGCDLSPHP